MLINQEIISFIKAALECSVYICPLSPGLEYNELVQAAENAGFFEGEINDAIPQAVTLYWGAGNTKILPRKEDTIILSVIAYPEEPDYRNPVAFHRVFEEMRLLVRQKGIANAQTERSALVGKCVTQQASTHDVQVAIAILTLNEILEAKDCIIRFARGKESWGSPGDQANQAKMPIGGRFQRPARARAYPIVQGIIAARDQPATSTVTEDAVQAAAAELPKLKNDEWISASKALDLLGRRPGNYIAICTRAHAGIVKTRAKLFIRDKERFENIELPLDFWWARGHEALTQNWRAGDFDTWIDHKYHWQAFGVEFLRSDVESMGTISTKEAKMSGNKVFIGHGRSLLWLKLRSFLQDRLSLTVDEFTVEPTAGITTKERLEEMLSEAAFAFLVMTAEDDQPDGTKRARENVIHEIGLFQGRLGFRKAIVMLEQGCNEFSNITGVGEIRFTTGDIEGRFEDVRRTLERENIIRKQ